MRGTYEGGGVARKVESTVERMCPVIAPEDDTEDVFEPLLSRGSTSCPGTEEVGNPKLGWYLLNPPPGRGGSTLSFSTFSWVGASSGVRGMGRLAVEDGEGVSNAASRFDFEV